MDREQEIIELCEKVLSISAVRFYNPNGPDEANCPFCWNDTHVDGSMTEIKHDPDCAYLIAKSLSTNLL